MVKRWIIRIGTGVLVLFTVVTLALGLFAPLFQGSSLRHDLLVATSRASRVRVVEHSDRFDSPFVPGKPYTEKVFRSVTLSTDEVSRLRKAFSISLDYSFVVRTLCMFRSHHRVEFVRDNGTVTTLEICFACGEIEFGGEAQRILPLGWDRLLERFIRSLGMSPIPKESNQAMQPPKALGAGFVSL